jgi:hypothetical protein
MLDSRLASCLLIAFIFRKCRETISKSPKQTFPAPTNIFKPGSTELNARASTERISPNTENHFTEFSKTTITP